MIHTPLSSALIDGIAELEVLERGRRPHRLPRHVRERDADAQLILMEAQSSGARIAFRTHAGRIELDVHATRVGYPMMKRPRGAIDIVIDGTHTATRVLTEGDAVELDPMSGAASLTTGRVDRIVIDDLPVGGKTIEIWLPHNEAVDLIDLRSDAPLEPAPPTGPLWLHHGSSISHGSNAATPTGIWPVVAARRTGARLRNLGFGGSALVDPFLARVIRDSPADLISVKLGINVVNLDAMRLRSFIPAVHGFLDTIRDGHPSTPLLLISPLYCAIHEDTPGPGSIDPSSLGTDTIRFTATGTPNDTAQGRLTLRVIRDALAEIAQARSDDPHLHHLDGLELFDAADAEADPPPDGLHPGPRAHALIGERFARRVFSRDGAFAGAI